MSVFICRTPMKEIYRENVGVRWCFQCRRRHEFAYVVQATVEPSYYDPNPSIRGVDCGALDSDLGFGRYREWE